MSTIQVNDREKLDSAYNIDTIDGVLGLILESWGPKDRNPDYAKAMEQILSRLKENGVPSINVYVVSRNLTKAFPKLRDRVITIDGSTDIGLINADPHDLRLGVFQGSCPIFYAARSISWSCPDKSFDGLSQTSVTGFQFLISPDQRPGFSVLAFM